MSEEVGVDLFFLDCGFTFGWMHMCSLDPNTALLFS